VSVRQRHVGRLSAALYVAISSLVAGIFLAGTTFFGDYTWVARVGGTAWIFLLSMIILMPTVTPWLRKRLAGQQDRSEHG